MYWDTPGFDDRAWSPVRLHAGPGVPLVAARDEGVEVVADLSPRSIERRSDGRYLVDFGQNIAGHVRLVAAGPRGTTITVRHAETLGPDGELYTANLRGADATDAVTLRGGAPEVFEPRFTFHGFRFAEIAGYSGRLSADRITARALSSATRMIGTFECSDPVVNAFFRIAAWSLRGNFISVPTDCPQRDERLGWTADAQVFAPSALFIADVANTLEKWLVDVQDAQHPSGAYPDYAPIVGDVGFGNAGWADAGVLVPWSIYEATGDRRVLERQYHSMRHYLAYLESDHTSGIRSAGRYGDWVSLGPGTSKDLVGTAYLAHVADVMGRIASVLGRRSDAARSARLARVARHAFSTTFVEAEGRIAGDTQTGYALALGYDLLPPRTRPLAAARLAAMIEEAGVHLLTGFLGLPVVMPALSDHDHHELACRLIAQEERPSWGFEVRQGATTIWERWDGWTPEAGFADPAMNSFNHYAFGAVVEWLVRHLVGLAPAEPGYRRVLIAPKPGRPFTFARARHESPNGPTEVNWTLDATRLAVRATIPPNATGAVKLHRVDPLSITLDGQSLRRSRSDGNESDDTVTFDISSGVHVITADVVPLARR